MKKHLHYSRNRYWNKLVIKFQNTYHQFIQAKDGTDRLKIKLLKEKLNNLVEKIKKLQVKVGVKIAGTALSLMLLSIPASSQNITYQGVVKSSSPMNIFAPTARPAFGDVDGDGDADLLLGTYMGNILYFQNTGQSYYTAKGNFSFDEKIYNYSQSQPVLIDFDKDGDDDLFVSNKNGYIFYYENNNSTFTLADTLKANGNEDFGSSTNIFFADWDGDNDYDLFVGDKNGYVTYYENNGTMDFAAGQHLQYNGSDIKLSNSCPALMDLDGDGHLDLFVGSGNKNINYYHNDGSNGFDSNSALNADGSTITTSSNSALTFFDIDGDGQKDLIVVDNDAIKYYKRNGTNFNYQSDLKSDQLTLSGIQGFSFGDFDNDGDLDLFIGRNKKVEYYKNDNNKFTYVSNLKEGSTEITSSTTNFVAPEMIDYDNDGDLDMFLGIDTLVKYYKYDNGTFAYQNNISPQGTLIHHAQPMPVIEDASDDGYADLFLGNNDRYLFHYANTGFGFEAESKFEFNNVANKFDYGVNVCFADIDNDGDADMLIGSNVFANFLYSLNNGSGVFGTIDTIKINGNKLNQLAGIFLSSADLNNDGKREIYLNNADNNIDIFTVPGATGLKDVSPKFADANIYSSKSFIIVDIKDAQDAVIEIYSTNGKLVAKKSTSESYNKFEGLTSGIYLVKVTSNKGLNTGKVVVQ